MHPNEYYIKKKLEKKVKNSEFWGYQTWLTILLKCAFSQRNDSRGTLSEENILGTIQMQPGSYYSYNIVF